ncbi:hypothetical protein [Hamadaea flava]|uniref:hypothetical protein n=1 Tax=Hamadaea flava TaxID=1742688 RepID=UPI0020A30DB5|nr:hypothetical protein [Hamadaea flava]
MTVHTRTAQPVTVRPNAWVRLARLHAASRRVPVALAALAACAIGLRVALYASWNTYGALQMPLMVEAGCAAAVVVTLAGPFGEPERVTGRALAWLRLGTVGLLTVAAVVALAVAATGMELAGGFPAMVRNVVGLIGIGLLCGVVLGGALAWTGPVVYLIVGVYGLYTQWHDPAVTTPWLWPSRPSHDLGGALCAGLVFLVGLVLFVRRGARDPID